MNKAVFLDRDGVINKETGAYHYRIDTFMINEGVIEALKVFRQKDYLLIIITNQGGIDKEIYTHTHVKEVHDYMTEILRKASIRITAIYYCPHHSVVSQCLCRKPGSLMLEKAMARFNIDPAQSYFIGDTDRDMEAGMKAGVKTIKIEANTSLLNIADKIE